MHKVFRNLSDGRVRCHIYASRGGPKLTSVTGNNRSSAQALADRRVQNVRPPAHKQKAKRIFRDLDHPYNISLIQSDIKAAIASSRKRAAKTGIDFNLTAEWVSERVKEQQYLCLLTGIRLEPRKTQTKEYRINPFALSIDRIDSRKGYTCDNCRVVCAAVNYALSDWGEGIFKRVAYGYVDNFYKRPTP